MMQKDQKWQTKSEIKNTETKFSKIITAKMENVKVKTYKTTHKWPSN